MREKLAVWREDRTLAHVVPFAVFMIVMLIGQFVGERIEWKHENAPWWRHWPEQLYYPIQSVLTFAVMLFFWKHYELKWTFRAVAIGAVAGAVGIAFWLLPTTLYDHLGMTGEPEGFWEELSGLAPRKEGFNPGVFEGAAYWVSLLFRFFRAAVVVALMEEIFWRGFLMRYLLKMDGDYWKVPFGKPAWISFLVVTGAFVVAHGRIDWLGALIYGSLTYGVCVWTRSLAACVVMHAVANALMGWYALGYGKYGLW
ncbi:MAG: CAAX prenyl protease-related protein [Verrucomicrobiales bacterium]